LPGCLAQARQGLAAGGDQRTLHAPIRGVLLHQEPGRGVRVDDQQPAARDAGGARRRRRLTVRRLGQRQLQIEGRAHAGATGERDGTAHQGHQPPADAQAQPTAAVQPRHRWIGLSIWGEQAVVQMLRNAHSGIAHGDAEVHALALIGDQPDRQPDFPDNCKLDRIAEQIEQHLTKPSGIAAQDPRHIRRHIEKQCHVLFSRARLDDCHRAIEQHAQVEIDAIEVEPTGFHAGQIEDVVDDREESLPGFVDGIDVVALLLAERRLEQHAGHADNRVHRFADLVAHGGEKQGLGLVRLLRRGVVLAHHGQFALQGVDAAIALGRRRRARRLSALSRHGSSSV
jgi:hypothetical protein